MTKGKIYLIPNLLGGEQWSDVLPEMVKENAIALRFFAVENIKSARRFLRRLDRAFPIDESEFFEINKRTNPEELQAVLREIKNGKNCGVISEAGCPGIADPGADLVALAHSSGIHVVPHVGPSSIFMALMASGFSGQSFAFHGYLPKERKQRIKHLKEMERNVKYTKQTQLFMETPFRNMNLLEDLLNELMDDTLLCVACDITLPTEHIQTMTVKAWRDNAFDLSKRPTIFALGNFSVNG